MTYSDRIKAIRLFLLESQAQVVDRFERPGDFIQEHWMIKGKEIILRLNQDGRWNAFIPCSDSADQIDQVQSLRRFLEGDRPDMKLIHDMGNLARTFLDRIQDLPGCSSPDCKQKACMETRILKEVISAFINRLFPGGETKKEEDATH